MLHKLLQKDLGGAGSRGCKKAVKRPLEGPLKSGSEGPFLGPKIRPNWPLLRPPRGYSVGLSGAAVPWFVYNFFRSSFEYQSTFSLN